MKKKMVLIGTLLALMGATSVGAATRVNVLWIGNSLTTAPWCSYEGWLATEVAANAQTATTGIELACYPAMMGATNLAQHWAAQRGVPELNSPIVRKPSDVWATENVDKYDYLVLQTYKPSTPAALTAESTAICNYADLALSKGTKPVIFACWDRPEYYAAEMKALDSCYAHYKSRGALIAPLYDAHKLIWPEKTITYLYVLNDDYHHENANGVYLNVCIFNYLFTKTKPSQMNFSVMPTCTDVAAVQAEKAYLDGKAESALSKYYTLSGTDVQPRAAMISQVPSARYGESTVFDISGRLVGKSLPAASNRIAEAKRNQVLVSRNAHGNGGLVVARDPK